MSDDFMNFSFGSGDDNVGKRTKRFKAETGRSYRVSLGWYSSYTVEGLPAEDANIQFTGCERIYKKELGFPVLVTPANRAALLELTKEQAKATVATVLVVWPCDKDGELDTESYKRGKGWQVMVWNFSPDKYTTLKQNNKRFPMVSHDITINCTDANYQKMTFAPETSNLLKGYLNAKDENLRAVGAKIVAEVRGVAANINADLARQMTIDEVREKLGLSVSSPTSNHASKDVDDLLKGIDL